MASMEKLMTDANDMGDAVVRTVDHAASSVQKGIHRAADQVSGAAAQAVEALGEKAVQLRDAQSRLTENCRTQVRDRPITAVGIAIAAGFLLSWVLSRR